MTFSVKLLFQAAVIAQKSLIGNRSIDILSSKIPNILFSRFFPNSYTFDFWKLSFSRITTKILTLQLIKRPLEI